MKKLKKIIKVVLPLLLGLLMAWSLTRKVEWSIVLQVLQQGIDWFCVFVSLVLAFLSHVIRAIRWRLQLRTLGIRPSLHGISVAIFGNYGLNLALPRVGELWRCSYVANRYNVPFSTTVGTMVSERLFDMLMAVGMLVLAFLHEREHFATFLAGSDGGQKFLDVLSSKWLWIGLALLLVLALLFARYLKHTRLFDFVSVFLRNMWRGIVGLKDVPNVWSYLAWSFALWFCYYLNSYTCCFFFGFTEHLDAWAGLAIFVMGSMSLVLPVQGGLGPWHYAVGTALLCYGIGETITDPQIQAFIWTAWTIEQLFVLLLGLYAMAYVGLRKNNNA